MNKLNGDNEATKYTNEGETNMTWHYGVAEYRFINEDGVEENDRAEVIEVFHIATEGKVQIERCWSDTNLLSDDATTMLEVIGRIHKDVAALNGKPSVVVMLDTETWRDREWYWVDQPEVKYQSEGMRYVQD